MSERKKGATSVSLLFRLTDSTTGAAKSAVDVTTLKLQYERPGEAASAATSLTLLGALTTAYTAFGAKEVDSTNSRGVYRVDCPNAAFATGADEVTLSVSGAGIETSSRLIDLLTVDLRAVSGNISATLAATALDAISMAEPATGPPTNFREWTLWLFRRFAQATKAFSGTSGSIDVKKGSGAAWTSQVITDDLAGNETVGPPT